MYFGTLFPALLFINCFWLPIKKRGKKKKSLVATSQIKAFTLEKALDFQIKLTRSKGMEEDECERALKKDWIENKLEEVKDQTLASG